MARVQRLPPVHALAAFEAAARLGGFAQAAGELCITPSAVSHRIRLLEAQIGAPLFDRSPTGVRLTEAGQRALANVREAFDKLSLLSVRQAPAVLRLRVGSPPTFARNLLIPRLPEFYRQFPEIEIEVDIVAPLQERHDRHDVDIRFGAGRFDDRPSSRLFDDRVAALAAPGYLARHPMPTPADLARAELLRSPLLAWRPWFAAAGLDWPEPTRGMLFTDLGILLEAAASGLGVAACTLRVAERWTGDGRLQPLFGLSVASPSTYWLVVADEVRTRHEATAFIDWLVAAFGHADESPLNAPPSA